MPSLRLLVGLTLALTACAHARSQVADAKEANARSFEAALERVLQQERAGPVSCAPTRISLESCQDGAPPLKLPLCDGSTVTVELEARRRFAATRTLESDQGPVTIDWDDRGTVKDTSVTYAKTAAGELLRVELRPRHVGTVEERTTDCNPPLLSLGGAWPVFLSARPVRTVTATYDVTDVVPVCPD